MFNHLGETILPIICFVFGSTFVSAQQVEVFGLGGQRSSLVMADIDGVLVRAPSNDGLNYYGISPLDFKSVEVPTAIQGPTNQSDFYAPIHLPDGVAIMHLGFWYTDDNSTSLVVDIRRVNKDGVELLTSKIVSTDQTEATLANFFFSPDEFGLINNQAYQYFIRIRAIDVNGPVNWPVGTAFYSAFIGYTY